MRESLVSVVQRSIRGASSAPDALSLTATTRDGVCMIQLRGELDPRTSPLFVALVDELFPTNVPSMVVMDLGGVTFLCAAGIRALLTIRRTVGDHGGHMVLRHLPPMVRRALTATGDLQYFEIRNVTEDAA
jgi:anti-anti-sigma factor